MPAPFPYTTGAVAITGALSVAYVVRWHIGPFPTTLLELSIWVTIATYLFEAVPRREWVEWRTPFSLAAALFVLAGALSVLVAPDKRAAAGLYRAYILEPIIFFLIASFVLRTWRRALLLLAGFSLAGIIVAVANTIVVLQAIRHHAADVSIAPPVVIYLNANDVALFLVPMIAVAASLLLYSRDRRVRLASAIFLVISLVATVLSFSRGGYLALAVVALGLALSHPRRVLLVPAAIAIAIVVSLVPPVARRIAHETNLADPNNTLQARFKLWEATLRMMRDRPIFGTGLSGFNKTIAPYRGGQYVETLIYPHNIVLNFWTETGLLGLAAFAWLIVQAVRVTLRGWRHGAADWRPLHLGVLLALAGVLTHGLVDVPYWKNDLSVEFWALLALTWAGQRWAAGAFHDA